MCGRDILHGERVTLRPLVPADLPRLREILATPSVAEWWGTGTPEAEAADLLDPGAAAYAIEVEGTVVGSIQVSEEATPDYRHASIDLFVDPAAQGRGHGSDAIRTVARSLFRRGHHRLTIDPAVGNGRAIRVYEQLGFRPVGVMRAYERGRDGVWHDGLLMDMLAGELREP